MKKALILSPANIPVLSKENAATFHQQVKAKIFETGNGLFEYIETIKFFSALDKQISGDTAAKVEMDKEFVDYIREQIKNNADGGKLYTTPRGVKFEVAETGTAYDFSKCEDPELERLELAAKEAADKLKAKKEFLKIVPAEGVVITDQDTGETVKVYPASKTSKSSFKVSLPK